MDSAQITESEYFIKLNFGFFEILTFCFFNSKMIQQFRKKQKRNLFIQRKHRTNGKKKRNVVSYEKQELFYEIYHIKQPKMN